MRKWPNVLVPLIVLTSSALLVVAGPAPVASAQTPVGSTGSEVYAVIQVETSPAYADDTVDISSTQLEASCGGTIIFETLQGGTTIAPRTSTDNIIVVLDDDGNVSLVVEGAPCAPGSDLIEADLTVAPYLTATTILDVEPPQVSSAGLTAAPANEVETGNSATSGESDVYTIFTVETSPVYAEQPVEISSPELDNRCGQGWRWEPGDGTPINQTSGTTEATGTIDDDGNATFVFKGASCAAGPSSVIADVEAGSHPTYTTTYTVAAPVQTLAATGAATAGRAEKTAAAEKTAGRKVAAHRHRRRRHHPGPKPSGTGPPATAPAMTVDASPDPLIETGTPIGGLSIVKSDNYGGSSDPPSTGSNNCFFTQIYTILVSNTGSTEVDGAVVSDMMSTNPDLTGDSYTATETGNASGFTASAVGTPFANIDDTVDLPPGSSITYMINVGINTDSTLSNTATLTPPSGPALSATDNDAYDFANC